MPLTSSNTYIEPTSGTSLSTARIYQNDNFRSLLSNFYSSSAPTAVNLTAAGASLAPVDGMLFRHSTTGALYVSDSINKKSAPVGGNFTRIGIGNRLEASLATLTTNKTTYEIGELVGTLDTGRLYIRTSNNDSISSFTDVGSPQGYTVGTLNNVTFTGQSVTATTFLATSNVGIKTSSPTAELHVTGNTIATGNAAVGSYITHFNDSDTFLGFNTDNQVTIVAGGATVAQATSSGITFSNVVTTSSSGLDITKTTSGTALTLTTTSNNTADAEIVFNKSRLGGQIVAGDDIGAIRFYGRNATTLEQAAAILVDSTTNTDYLGGTLALSTNNLVKLRVQATADVNIYGNLIASGDVVAYSDARLKSNIRTIDNALQKVSQLRGVYFEKDEKTSIGLIAQEVQDIIPEVVSSDKYLAVAYGNLVGLLVEAVKDLAAEVERLQNAITR